MKIFDAFIAYQFIKIIATPWDKMPAYELGIVDEDGNQLKKSSELETAEEKKAYTVFHRLIFNLKRLLNKLPFGRTKLASYAAALALLKEDCEREGVDFTLMENGFIAWMEETSLQEMKLFEEAPTVSAGGGNVAGIGVGPKGEPGVKRSKFAGHTVIHVDGDTFNKLRNGKRKNKHWRNYVNMESATGHAIRMHFRNSPGRRLFMQWGDDGPIQEIMV